MPHAILFVDDEPQVLELLRHTFPASAGYEALTASDPTEALTILAERDVDLLVTDQRMPGMSGVELVARAHERRPDLCAILLTAYTNPQEIVEAINRGQVYRYVVKPWETADLRQTVMRALEQVGLKREKARLHDELERRLAALRAATEIARDVGVAGNYASLVERLLTRIPGIVRCDLAAALVAPKGSAPVLVVERVESAGEEALVEAKDGVLAAWEDATGQRLAEADLQVRVSGRAGGPAAARAMRSRLVVPLELSGETAGLVMLLSSEQNAFGEGDARVLDLLANELAESLQAFAAKLGKEWRRLERVVECMADGLLVADLKLDEVIANPAARRMLHAPEGQPLSIRWLKETLGFYPFDLVRGLPASGPGPALLTEELRLFDRTLSSIVSPVTDGEGGLSAVAVVLRDVTEQKRLEERKEEFVQVVSHELRTPLTAITGALDLVLAGVAGDVGEKPGRYLRMARESTEKLNAIVDDLLDLGKLARGKLKMDCEVTYLDELLRGAVEKYAAAASEKELDLSLRCPREPVRVVADPGRIGQVLSNLFTNAVKFTPERGLVRVSLFRPAAVPGWVGLSVWNSGEHVADADLERIFEKFEQARSDRTRRVRGTGLGLAICRSIVEAHGGRIWAESAPGHGVRFVVVLPAEPPAKAEGGLEAAVGTPPSVLVVDDPETAPIVKAVLLANGFPCASASTIDDALAVARRFRPQLACVDVRGAGPEGTALLEILRHDAETRDAPILVFSVPEEREAALRAGASGFLAKPAAPDALVAALESVQRGARRSDHRILVVDDDPAIRAICLEVLGNHGFSAAEADSCAAARRAVQEMRPHLLLVDVQLPDGDGFSLVEDLKDARAAEPLAVVFLSARGQTADKVRAFRLGADDYLTKPFDALELVARIDAVLRRRDTALAASPTTRLPGGRAIEQEVERRLLTRRPFTFCYLDLDNLKAYNDHYGYAKADGIVLQTADLLRAVVSAEGGEGAFVGHVGGDDFVFIVAPERAERICREVIAAFDRLIPLYYDREDRERGYIEAEDRFGVRRRFPIMSISVVSVEVPAGRYPHHSDIARIAADLKKRAKATPGSIYLRADARGHAALGRA